jgi:hypothetical protein
MGLPQREGGHRRILGEAQGGGKGAEETLVELQETGFEVELWTEAWRRPDEVAGARGDGNGDGARREVGLGPMQK